MNKFTYSKWYSDMDKYFSKEGNYYEFEISNNHQSWIVLFDQEDKIDEITKHSWRIRITPSGAEYAITSIKKDNGKWSSIGMHNIIMGYKDGLCVDHINHNTLDNRKSNLRFVTRQHNAVNRKSTKGYYLSRERYRQNKPWFAYIFIKGKGINLGGFKTEEEAKQARLQAENKYYPNVRH